MNTFPKEKKPDRAGSILPHSLAPFCSADVISVWVDFTNHKPPAACCELSLPPNIALGQDPAQPSRSVAPSRELAGPPGPRRAPLWFLFLHPELLIPAPRQKSTLWKILQGQWDQYLPKFKHVRGNVSYVGKGMHLSTGQTWIQILPTSDTD